MDNILEETRKIMKKYNIKANKSLGQNFLINDNVVTEIIKASNITSEDLVIEIGPGLGTLTKEILKKAGKVICIELDKKMVQILNDRFGNNEKFNIINEDVLKVDLNKIIKEEKETGKIKNAKIVANLPYYITTPIIMKLLEEKLDLEQITVMIQKEVAKRLTAKPGNKETGAITYSIYYYAIAKELLEVEKESFIPAPEVTSEVIELKIRKEKPIKIENEEEEKRLFKIIKSAFTQRRKTLLNALVNTKIFENKTEGQEILKKLGLEENIRAEKLTLEDFANLEKIIK